MIVGQPFNPFGLFVGSFIPNCIQRLDYLTSSDKLVWGRLYQYSGQDGKCYPKQDTIAEELGMTKTTVRNSLDHLVDNGFISITKVTGTAKLMHQNNSYIFLWHSCFEYDSPCAKNLHLGVKKTCTPTKEENNKEEKETTKHAEVQKRTSRMLDEKLLVHKRIAKRTNPPTQEKTFKLFQQIKNNPTTDSEDIVYRFLSFFAHYRNEQHPPISDDQIQKGLALIDEHMDCMDDFQIDDVLTQHFKKKLWIEQGRDFRFGLFTSNLHMYTSERYK